LVAGTRQYIKRKALLSLQDFRRYFDSVIQHIEGENERTTVAETRWKQRWKSDVENVKLLY
jgi:hypothetical protein